QMANPPVFHRRPGLLEWRLDGATGHLGRHHVGDGGGRRWTLLADHAAQHVPLGEHADDAIVLDDDKGADLVLVHHLGRLKDSRIPADGPDVWPLPGHEVTDGWH